MTTITVASAEIPATSSATPLTGDELGLKIMRALGLSADPPVTRIQIDIQPNELASVVVSYLITTNLPGVQSIDTILKHYELHPKKEAT